MTQKTLTLIDGSGFIFRAYHVLPPMTNPKGVPVAAVYGFTNMLLKFVDGERSDYIAVIFDASRQTFRNRMYDQYKAHRPEAPEDLIPQFPLVRDAARAMGLPVVELVDYEADDIIATYICAARDAGMKVKIVSSDKDLMQCIDDNVSMWDPMKGKPIAHAEVFEKFGVTPDKVVDVLALIGDSSDNVPGVPGIGPKTAAELINQYGTLEGLLTNAHEIKQPKRRDVILANADKARLSYKLVKLCCDVPLPIPLEELATKQPEPEKLQAFMAEHGFRSLLSKLKSKFDLADIPVPPPVAVSESEALRPPVPPAEYTLIQDKETLLEWIDAARWAGAFAFDCETTSLDANRAELIGFSLCIEPGKAAYVPLAHRNQDSGAGIQEETALEVQKPVEWAEGSLFAPAPVLSQASETESLPKQIPLPLALEIIKPLLEDEAVLKIGQNIKYDMVVLNKYSIRITPVDDSMLMSYCMHAGLHAQNMDELAQRYLGIKTITFDEVTGTGRNRLLFSHVPLEKARDYAAEDADVTLQLAKLFKTKLFSEHLLTLYETIERPLIPVIAEMESCGVRVDALTLARLSSEFEQKMRRLEEEIYAICGHPFNIGSPKQLGEVLFDEQQLPGGKKSGKTGAYVTDIQVLEELAEAGHALPSKVIEWRQVSKLKSTYTDALVTQIDPRTGRVHTSYSMAVAATGRLSSTDPNLQNIPIRTEEGRVIRTAFVADPGYSLISADYSQIELRLLAHMADIAPLKAAFKEGRDIHAATASQMFGVPVDQVAADLRRKAKTINFGIIYGISAHGLAVRLNIGRAEAATYIEQYFRQYPGIKDYMEKTKTEARQHGYVTSLFGRRCHVPGILDKNPARRQYAERAAINAPLQGTAADIIKRAMIAVHNALKESQLDARMLLQVHDELVFEVKQGQEEALIALIKPAMEHAAYLSVPLLVETGMGNNWGESH